MQLLYHILLKQESPRWTTLLLFHRMGDKLYQAFRQKLCGASYAMIGRVLGVFPPPGWMSGLVQNLLICKRVILVLAPVWDSLATTTVASRPPGKPAQIFYYILILPSTY